MSQPQLNDCGSQPQGLVPVGAFAQPLASWILPDAAQRHATPHVSHRVRAQTTTYQRNLFDSGAILSNLK